MVTAFTKDEEAAVTVTVKLVCDVRLPSFTVTVINEVPLVLAAGVKVNCPVVLGLL